MASTKQLKTRIRSVKNTKQITKAMEMVAASKMRRAQDASKASSAYAKAARELLAALAVNGATDTHPLFQQRPVATRLVILITSNKGLAGAYNANVIKRYTQVLKENEAAGIRTKTITIGRKGAQFVARLKHVESLGNYEDFSERPTGNEIRAILATLMQAFQSGEVDAVDVIYTEYVNSLKQQPTQDHLLPAGVTDELVTDSVAESTFEPSPEEVLDGVTQRLVEAQLFQALLDSVASEHSMRMMAMKNATDNAGDIIDDLTLEMNKVRQSAITQELAEISNGAAAVK